MTTTITSSTSHFPPVPVSSWATRVTDWETRNAGKLWQCRFIGEHHGAEVVQYVTAHWFGHWVWHYSTLYVDRRGPSCPVWCSEHANTIPDSEELQDECIQHAHRVSVGDAAVDLAAIEDAETGEFVEVSVSLPDSGPMDAATARQVAAALTQAVSLLDGRC
ncbi:MAG: hypothetical protein VB036_12790 [Propionicimonas sp.]|nr:hypothetical protein [Propionicimonas sp.]